MSYTLFKTSAASTGLIAQPGRAVNTFASGLVRVDQTYLGLTANASANRAILAVGNDMPDGDSTPCIDGLKIFPEVQERRREDGFTEYIVSAYGRINTTGTVTSISSSFKIPVYAQKGQFSCTDLSCDFFLYGGAASFLPMDYINIVLPLPTLKIVLAENQFPQIDSIANSIPIYDTNGNNITNKLYHVYDFLNGNYSVGINNPPISFTSADYHYWPVNYFGSTLDQYNHPYVTPGFSGSKIPLEITHSNINATNYGKFTEFIVPITNVAINNLYTGLINFGAFYKKEPPLITESKVEVNGKSVVITFKTLKEITSGPCLNAAKQLEIEIVGRGINSFQDSDATITVYNLNSGMYTVNFRAQNDYGVSTAQSSFLI